MSLTPFLFSKGVEKSQCCAKIECDVNVRMFVAYQSFT